MFFSENKRVEKKEGESVQPLKDRKIGRVEGWKGFHSSLSSILPVLSNYVMRKSCTHILGPGPFL